MVNGIRFGDIHSYENLNLILSKVDLPPAAVKTTYVDNPGGDGSWDLTEANGKVNYKNRTAKFTFSVLPEDDFEAKKTEVSNLLNGRRFKITLDKDPEYYWDGRCSVDKYSSNKKMRQIVISANVAPYKLKQEKTRAFVPFCGKNLFDCNDLQTVSLGAMTISSIATGVRAAWKNGAFSYAVLKFLPLEMLVGKTITFSCNIAESGGVKGTMQMGYSSADGTTRKSAAKLSQSGAISFKVEKTNPEHEYLVIWFYSNNGTDPASVSSGAYVDYTNITIELGNTVEKRRNLIPYPYLDTTKTTSGITFTDNGDGSISIKGTSTASTYFLLTNGDFGEKSISATNAESATNGEYTLSKRLFYDISNNGLVFININANTTVDEVLYPQLEKGTVATEYTPFVPFEAYTPSTEAQEITLSNGRKTVSPLIICTGEANFNVEGLEFALGEGTHKVLEFSLPEGETTVSVSGTGAAAIVYQEGDL